MLFERRRWARRVTAEMGLRPESREATWLVKLAVRATTRQASAAREGLSRSLPKMDRVLFVGVEMHRSPMQVTKLMRKLGISQDESRDLLLRFARGASALAVDLGLADIAAVAARHGLRRHDLGREIAPRPRGLAGRDARHRPR